MKNHPFLHTTHHVCSPIIKWLLLILFLFQYGMQATCHAKDFTMQRKGELNVFMEPTKRPVAQTALGMLVQDAQRVLSCQIKRAGKAKHADIIVTQDSLLPREGFSLDVRKGKLHITGADAHGMAYGLLEVSRLMGVSPWEYWADCTPQPRSTFTLPEGYHDEQHPAVAYRGIFINDEDWGLNPWATRQEPEAWTLRKDRIKGAIGPKVNERIFQLLLRLRANYYWPAMHECSQPFFTIPGNREVAERYGIYIGGSHCEPMGTSPAAEWGLSGIGDYNYVTNREAVQQFWKKRLDEVGSQEMVYTIGMRGVHDGSMQGVKTKEEKLHYLQMVIDDQREMLKAINKDVTRVPQVFVPYKEVLEIYQSGLKVPDDVTLMWTDDNYGYIRHFPDAVERSRKGGNGVYYHASYWGRPHDYLWLNSLSPTLLESQMLEAYQRGIRQMWVLNVGDIKPAEYQTELFMQLAWTGQPQRDYLQLFAEREFGSEHAQKISHVLATYFRLSAEMKPEHMAGTRTEESDKAYWNSIHPIPGDWTKGRIAERIADYQTISDDAELLYAAMPADRRDAFFQLVKYPVQGAAQMNFKFLCPDRCLTAHDSIQALTRIYNKVCANGKWDGIMDASPRRLPVFDHIAPSALPSYPDHSEWQALESGSTASSYSLATSSPIDSLTLRVDLVPNHPFEGGRLAFALSIDGQRTEDIEFQTYDRSEEWKQNVLKGYATRTITLPIDPSRPQHTIHFIPTTAGTQLYSPRSIYVKVHQGIK